MAQFLSLVIISLLFQLSPFISTSASNDIRFHLTHVDSKLNLTKPELFRRGVDRTKHRIASITNSLAATSTNNVQAPVHAAGGAFETEISIGTPPTRISLIVDTGSDLLWTQCKPCIHCYPQTYAIYDPSHSTSFSKIACSSSICQSLSSNQQCNGTDCDYSYLYGGGSFTDGVLASETFSFGSASPVSVPGLAFGCGNNNSLSPPQMDVDGLMGLGRRPLSIVTQLGSGKFSYCLTSIYDESKTSPLLIGSSAVLTGSFQSTPLVVNPSRSTFYYITLQGITVGSTLLQIPSTVFALNSDGSGGLFIDSGTTFTALQYQAYRVLAQEFQSQVDLPVIENYPLCFSYDQSNSTVKIPDIVFHFDGADMTIPPPNSMYNITAGVQCLVILASDGLSILGNFQQQNMHILYDLNSNKLSFAPAQCDQI